MTLDELKAMDTPTVSPKVAAQFFRCDPYAINIAARDDPDRLPIKVCRTGKSGKWVRIPRLALIKWVEEGGYFMGYNIQDTVLKEIQDSKESVTIITINGYQMHGKITGHDEAVIVLNDGKRNIVYKHAVSTIVPDKPAEL